MVKRGRVWKLNPVAIGLGILLTAIIYLGIKFIPHFWDARKVDQALESTMFEASRIELYENDNRKDRLLESLFLTITDRGIDERYLDVYFNQEMNSIHADYIVQIELLGLKTVTLEFERAVDIPAGPGE